MDSLILYSTLGCHLCDQAKTIIWPILEQHSLKLAEVDIADSAELMQRYAVTIPVVRLDNRQEELHWPFSAAELEAYLSSA